MRIDHPTTTIYFIFAFTFCKVKVYRTEEAFLRKLLELSSRTEPDDGRHGDENYTEIDTRILTAIIADSLRSILERVDEVARAAEEIKKAFEQTKP